MNPHDRHEPQIDLGFTDELMRTYGDIPGARITERDGLYAIEQPHMGTTRLRTIWACAHHWNRWTDRRLVRMIRPDTRCTPGVLGCGGRHL